MTYQIANLESSDDGFDADNIVRSLLVLKGVVRGYYLLSTANQRFEAGRPFEGDFPQRNMTSLSGRPPLC